MAQAAALLAELAAIVGPADVLYHDAAAGYLKEWRGAFRPTALAVVRPGCTAAVADVVRACARAEYAVIAQSGNTGLVGGSAASDAERHVIVNLERMDRVRELDADNATLTVEAGCILADARRAAQNAGLYLPLSLASESQCRIGGNLATNAGGLNVVRYGNMRDLVLGLEVVLADGRVWHNLRGLRKDNSGFDLNDLFVGSEGALGIITAAVLRLHALPVQRATALLAVAEPADAVALQRRLRGASGENLTGCELISAQAMTLVTTHFPDCRLPLAAHSPWYLLVELASAAKGDWLRPILVDEISRARELGRLREAFIADSDDQAARLWRLRAAIPPAQVAEGASIKHDISLPVSRLPLFLERALAAVCAAVPGVRPCPFGHVGDGNLHFNFTRPVGVDGAVFHDHAGSIHDLVHRIVIDMGGSIAAEHGVGRLKADLIERTKAPVEYDMLCAIKNALDPRNRLNPGAVVDTGKSRAR